MRNNIFKIITASVLVVLLLLLSDPFMLWMPDKLVTMVLLAAAGLLCVWIGFIASEGAIDEREVVHRMNAGRVAYLLGIGVLTAGLIFQGLSRDVDPWIATALGLMVVSKLGARLYTDRYH